MPINPVFIVILSAALYIFGYYRMPFVYGGFFLQLAYMVLRGIDLGRLPLIGPHDTLFFLSASFMLFGIPVSLSLESRQRFLNPVTAITVCFMLLAMLARPHNYPLPPVLKTFWFEVHVAFSFFSYALFGLAAVLGALYLISRDEESEILQYKMVLVGYFLFSLAMILGGIWAYYAWGTYWLWTPKELWTVILWLFYSFYLHARLRQWWAGRPAAILGIAGFGIVMFTYLGVSLLMKSSHTF
ncbi:MAG: cytochrome C biogenesis protein ResC [Nitrospiraceae bacterium]|jgi:ABC-type transport system involved in cytochrome c biogenesis permease subunit|nr:MAG: cytochrome C biogenesis protein ResC [Nitrospiraceae bacterium]